MSGRLYRRFETIAADFANIASALGLSTTSLPHENATQHRPYREYYTRELADRVGEFYRVDVEKFGYSNPFDSEE